MGKSTEDDSVKNGTVTFGWFARNRYLPLKEADWREETAKVKKTDHHGRSRSSRSRTYGSKSSTSSPCRIISIRLAKTHSKDRVLADSLLHAGSLC